VCGGGKKGGGRKSSKVEDGTTTDIGESFGPVGNERIMPTERGWQEEIKRPQKKSRRTIVGYRGKHLLNKI